MQPRTRRSRRTLAVAVLLAALTAPSVPTQAGPAQPTLTLTPQQATNNVGTPHTVFAELRDGTNPMPGEWVWFGVQGANPHPPQQKQTDDNGKTSFTYTGLNAGQDQIFAFGDINPQDGNFNPGDEPTAQAQKTFKTPKDPRADDWPKLTADEMKAVQDLIGAGKNAEALAKLVETMKKYCCSFDTMAGGAPEYDPNLDDEGACERKKGGKVRIGKGAFTSAAWLYSSLKHEMVHSSQWQDEDAARGMGSKGREKEAYQREIDNAGNTGISEAEKKDLEKRIKAYE